MKYCPTCLQPDTRPNASFDEQGRCPACVYHTSLQGVDWAERRDVLIEEINRVRAQPGNGAPQFDCLLGVSGGKDSTRQALWVRDNLRLKPLLVLVTYPPRQLTERGAANIANLVELGFDLVTLAPPPETWRQMMRESFLQHANWAKSTEMALFAGVPKLATELQIPLILWGENPGLQLGDQATLGRSGWDGNQLRHMNTLAGGDIDWLRDAGFSQVQLLPYRYPTVEQFDAAGLQIIFLGWALGDWSLLGNSVHAALNGLVGRSDTAENTGDLYGFSSVDEDWVTLNQMIKYYKFGFGRATDYLNEMIRRGQIERELAIDLAERYDGACSDEYIYDFCEFIGISTASFWKVVRESTDPRLFRVTIEGRPQPRFKVGVGLL